MNCPHGQFDNPAGAKFCNDCGKGENEKAGSELGKAIDLYRSIDMIFWLPEAEAILGEVSGKVVS